MPYNFANISILVVDDNQALLNLNRALLTSFGCRSVFTASNISRAYEIFCQEDIDLVISDWHMPDGDGLSLTRQIRTEARSPNPFVPILLLTGYSNEPLVHKARDAGITEFLSKPFTADEFYNRLCHMISFPRDFVMSDSFCGPDRRRTKMKANLPAEALFRRYTDTAPSVHDDVFYVEMGG